MTSHGAMIYPNEADEWNALHLAALYNHPELIRILVQDYGIDIEVGLEASFNIVYTSQYFYMDSATDRSNTINGCRSS